MADQLANRIRAARVYSGLSRLQLATKLEVSERTQTNTELGKRHVPRPELLAIAESCGVPMWFLEQGWDGWQEESIDDVGRRALRGIEGSGRRAAGE